MMSCIPGANPMTVTSSLMRFSFFYFEKLSSLLELSKDWLLGLQTNGNQIKEIEKMTF
jgi:hypothetical protein